MKITPEAILPTRTPNAHRVPNRDRSHRRGLRCGFVIAAVVTLCAGQVALAQVEWTWMGPPVVQPGPPGSWDDGRLTGGEVVFDGTTYHMYLVGGAGIDGIDNPWSIGHWTSSALGGTWEEDPYNPVLAPGAAGDWDAGSLITVAVRYDGASFHMWYGAFENVGGPTIHGGYATSLNGSFWQKYGGNPLPGLGPGQPGAWDEAGAAPATVLFVGGLYRMWFQTSSGPSPWSGTWSIGYATSADGLSWSRHPTPVLEPTLAWEADKLYYAKVIPYAGGFAMWYSAIIDLAFGANIGYAVSPDGIRWGKWPDNPVLTPLPPCSFVDGMAVIADGTMAHGWVSHCVDCIWYIKSSLDVIFFDSFETGDTSIWGAVVP